MCRSKSARVLAKSKQCVCRALRCVAACCRVSQCVAACGSKSGRGLAKHTQCVATWCSVSQRVAACCSVLQCVAGNRQGDWRNTSSVLQRGVVCCSVLQRVAVCCNVLQEIGKGTGKTYQLQHTATHCNTLHLTNQLRAAWAYEVCVFLFYMKYVFSYCMACSCYVSSENVFSRHTYCPVRNVFSRHI